MTVATTLPAKVALAAGGTGGHMFPAQALARELLSRGIAVMLITDKRGGGFGPDLPQVETYRIPAGAMAGAGIGKKLRSAAQLALGYLRARSHLKRGGAEVAVGFGGYPSVPTILAAAHRGLRVVLHEQNSVLGRANRLLAPRAGIIATSFDRVEGIAAGDRNKIRVTGNPVRPAVAAIGTRPYAVPGEGDALRLLVVGGSQGAAVFNDVVPAAIAQLPEELRSRLRVHQQVPGQAGDTVAEVYRGCGVAHDLAPFFDDVPARLAAAHLVISRAGASTVAELAAAGRPAVMVPYPLATDDHQTGNAQALVEVGGGWLMPQSDLDAESLCKRLTSLLSTPALLARAASCAHAAAHLNAASDLADLICGIGHGNGDRLQPGSDNGPGTDNNKEAAA
ncbi:undecaprenyldiphospho-muramoylpentapeptide beta-N-acetylglucosaminyltransferase [Pelagibius litoralis]|uniref:UDP-N-acetylglucosamine--N-acetylmuramyl-(pentapeptide) pyrophosphoryl-undecaprenol N-acetylglucosamine transferase n=1 Tax=Pelagibius litoralis TaxID=374515 RepID=A0A967C541_9PROT|nr:undecaprenyldiphospho-muramoylpentapeptide beta-N-acetylglucosaminyltransferase [Pelagibius litoralis]NIA68625.1 undecaprenyldiphospho-muramoylpentapeptide beta-N-acetylglucosaminyltransferase [Pelagibius litoralis]